MRLGLRNMGFRTSKNDKRPSYERTKEKLETSNAKTRQLTLKNSDVQELIDEITTFRHRGKCYSIAEIEAAFNACSMSNGQESYVTLADLLRELRDEV